MVSDTEMGVGWEVMGVGPLHCVYVGRRSGVWGSKEREGRSERKSYIEDERYGMRGEKEEMGCSVGKEEENEEED